MTWAATESSKRAGIRRRSATGRSSQAAGVWMRGSKARGASVEHCCEPAVPPSGCAVARSLRSIEPAVRPDAAIGCLPARVILLASVCCQSVFTSIELDTRNATALAFEPLHRSGIGRLAGQGGRTTSPLEPEQGKQREVNPPSLASASADLLDRGLSSNVYIWRHGPNHRLNRWMPVGSGGRAPPPSRHGWAPRPPAPLHAG